MPPSIRKQWAQYQVRQNPNFGGRTTSPVESSNFNIKSYLLNGRGNFLTVYKALCEMVKHQYKLYNEKVASEQVKIATRYLTWSWMGELPRNILFYALARVENEHAAALKAIPAPSRPRASMRDIGECKNTTCTERIQWGLPCRHEIAQKILAGEDLHLRDVHPRWLLESRMEASNPYSRIKDPLPAPSTRGRPKGAKNKGPNTPKGRRAPTAVSTASPGRRQPVTPVQDGGEDGQEVGDNGQGGQEIGDGGQGGQELRC